MFRKFVSEFRYLIDVSISFLEDRSTFCIHIDIDITKVWIVIHHFFENKITELSPFINNKLEGPGSATIK